MTEAAKYNRFEKNAVRSHVFMDLGRTASNRKNILTLPSDGRLCVSEMAKHGIITPETKQTWLETRTAVFDKLVDHASDAVTVRRVQFENFVPDTKYDLINADMECAFTKRFGLALEENYIPNLEKNGVVVAWVIPWSRNSANSKFHKWLTAYVKNLEANDPSHPLAVKAAEVASIKASYTCDRERLIILFLMMACVLKGYDYTMIDSHVYKDTKTPMLVMGYDQIRRSSEPHHFPSFSDLIRLYNEQNTEMDDEDKSVGYKVAPKPENPQVSLWKKYCRDNGWTTYEDGGEWVIKETGLRSPLNSLLSTFIK